MPVEQGATVVVVEREPIGGHAVPQGEVEIRGFALDCGVGVERRMQQNGRQPVTFGRARSTSSDPCRSR